MNQKRINNTENYVNSDLISVKMINQSRIGSNHQISWKLEFKSNMLWK